MKSYLFICKQILLPYYKRIVCFQKLRSVSLSMKEEDYSWLFVGYILQSYSRIQYKPKQFIR